MATRGSDSPGRNSRKKRTEAVESHKSKPGKKLAVLQKTDWITRERRRPENAKIRHWMDLADKVLRER